jgi:hypothetical protein
VVQLRKEERACGFAAGIVLHAKQHFRLSADQLVHDILPNDDWLHRLRQGQRQVAATVTREPLRVWKERDEARYCFR